MTTYVISDLHLGHEKCVTEFTRADGSPLRDFESVEHMNGAIINNINTVVGLDDKLIILGDVVINKKFIPLLGDIQCKNLILVGGNHDVHYDLLQPYFKSFRGCMEFSKCILTHIPVHPRELRRFALNIHGHLHSNVVDDNWGNPNPHYVNVSVEQTNFFPVNLHDLIQERLNETGQA